VFCQSLACNVLRAVLIAVWLAACPSLQTLAIAAGTSIPPAKERRVAPKTVATPLDFASIAERYGPAVVNISTTPPAPQAAPPIAVQIDSNDPLFAFLKRVTPQPQEASKSSAPRAISGIGSGFIVRPDGLILTTAHVVDQAEEVTVQLADHRQFKAKVLVIDAQNDVAVIQIGATRLPTVKLGDSSRVRVGEPVLTIGSPDGSETTATAGIVSATSHAFPDGTAFPFFQTTVSPNPDNSGGPLFNRDGEVVGIDVQIYAGEDPYSSLTFAIPINLANKVRAQAQPQLKAGPSGLGVEVQDLNPGLAAAFGLPRTAGALVNSVEPGTPAAAAGVQPGDVIVEINDKEIERSAELLDYAAGLQPGTKASLRLIRNRKPMVTTFTVAASARGPATQSSEASAPDRLGLTVHPLSADERRARGLAAGLIVDAVQEPAASAGIVAGDVVLSVNGTMVESPQQMDKVAERSGKHVALLIQRDNSRTFVSIELR
jgi:serine protease Do